MGKGAGRLVRRRADGIGQVEDGLCFRAVRANQGSDITEQDRRVSVRHVHLALVHRDAAYDGEPLAVDQDLPYIREATRETIGVPHSEGGDP